MNKAYTKCQSCGKMQFFYTGDIANLIGNILGSLDCNECHRKKLDRFKGSSSSVEEVGPETIKQEVIEPKTIIETLPQNTIQILTRKGYDIDMRWLDILKMDNPQ